MIANTPEAPAKTNTEVYIPMVNFVQMMKTGSTHPYRSKLSFKPFMAEYKERLLQEGIKDELIGEIDLDVSADAAVTQEHVAKAVAKYFPDLFLNEGMIFLTPPFQKDFLYLSPLATEIMSSPHWEIKVSEKKMDEMSSNNIFGIGATILNKCYDQQLLCEVHDSIEIRNSVTGLTKIFQLQLNLNYVWVKPTTKLKQLTQKQIQALLRAPSNKDLWMKHFPPENFEFEGFVLGSLVDVTKNAVVLQVSEALNHGRQNLPPNEFLPVFGGFIRNFLSIPDLDLGFIGIRFAHVLNGISFGLANTNDLQVLYARGDGQGGAYHECMTERRMVLIEDLSHLENPSEGEIRLLDAGYKSVILFPPTSVDGSIPMIFEIGCKSPNALNHFRAQDLQPIFKLMQEGSDGYLEEVEKNVGFFIQQHFTSIHPSVRWKFEEVARNYQVKQNLPDFDGEIEDIVFDDVYPLYGQADIVGSSKIRNKSIRLDLIENLTEVAELLYSWQDHVQLFLLQSMIDRVEQKKAKLKSAFIARHETEVIELLQTEVHPYLRQLHKQYSGKMDRAHKAYFAKLDPNLQIIYHQRKNYEQSVTRLNQAISNLVEEKDSDLQRTLPHYFEKYKTDGIEYNIYVGQSILAQGQFNLNHLREFRLWQLIQMCEITRLVEAVAPSLAVPLHTAQLIFVFNNSLSIRFRMDEKQFDVDGTYNVRYEILKKRIDKALIKGSTQRLTLPQTVSIVYLQEKDRIEYLEYLSFLIHHGYIATDYEELELEKLQGAEGLRALRLKVLPPAS